jgi:hypothetical protein
MAEDDQTPRSYSPYDYVVGSNERPSERAEVLPFLIRPHGFEPGKMLHADFEQALLAPPSVTDLLSDMKEARRQSDHLEIATIVYFAITVLTALGLLLSRDKDPAQTFCAGLLALSLFIITVDAALKFFRVGSAQAAIARMMARYQDLRVVGPLAAALLLPDDETRHLAALALRHLLPRLRADHADLLNEPQRNVLYRCLRRRDIELSVAILKALEQVGDAKAVSHVERLADTAERVDPRVRKAAEECLPYLLIRIERENAPRILLRASSNADTAPETLLRTVAREGDRDASRLLRSVDGN